MKIPTKALTNWKDGNLGAFLIGVWYLIIPWLVSGTVHETMVVFGLTFIAVALVRAKPSPSIVGAICTAFLGINYFLFLMTAVPTAALWTFSIILFAIIIVLELEIFKLGPTAQQAKYLTIVPLTLLGFCILLGVAGFNPYIIFNWNFTLVALNYIAVMLFCFLFVFERVGYRPLGKNTILWMNLMAVAAVLLSLIGVYQGSLFQWL